MTASAWALFHVACVLSFHLPVLWAADGPWTLGGDARTSYWQDVVVAVGHLREGELPLWNPYERGGYPFAADPQTAVWGPVTWSAWALGLVSGSNGGWLQDFRQLGSLALAGAGLHLFLHRRGVPHVPAALGGLALSCGGFAQRAVTMATLWPWAFLGLVLAAFEFLRDRPGWSRTRVATLALVGLGTAGFPPSIFYALWVVIPYAILRLVASRDPRAWRWVIVAGALAGIAELVVLLPLRDLTALSVRAERGLGYALSDPNDLATIASLVVPDSGKSLYLGVIVLGLAGFALVRGRRDVERWLWFSLAALGLVLSLGEATPVLPFLAEHVPGFGLFRVCSRWAILTHTGLAVLAAYGAADVWPRIVARRGGGILGGLVLAIALVDLHRVPARVGYSRPHQGEREALAREIGDARVYNEWTFGPRGGGVYRVRDWRGRSKDPMALERYMQAEAAVTRTPAILGHFAVQWLLTEPHPEARSRPHLQHPGSERSFAPHGSRRWRVRTPAPDAFWTADVRRVREGKALRALAKLEPGRTAVVERDLGLPKGSGIDPVAATVERPSTRSLGIDVVAPAAGVLVVAEVWHPDWVATVDGTPVPIERAQHALRAVVVPAGSHRVEMAYRPRSIYIGASAWLLVIVAVAFPWPAWWARARRRRAAPAQASD
jgi:hypothetical protein